MHELGEEDERVLAFMAEHRIVLPAHVERLLGASGRAAQERLRSLHSAGYVRRERPFAGQSTFHLITSKGLRAIGSTLRHPRFDLSLHEHDVGLAWLWLAARRGTFGRLGDIVSERRMRSQDAIASPSAQPLAVRLGGIGAAGRERLHYPDLLLLTPEGGRIALELELTTKGRTAREKILAGYAADVRIDAVLYLVTSRASGRAIQSSARSMGIEHLVHVQMAALSNAAAGGADRVRTAQRAGLQEQEASR